MAYTKKAINDKYDKLRAQLKAGTIDQKKFKASADRLYKLYHGDANKATRNKVGPAKSAPTPKPKAGGKTGKAVLELGGSNVKKVTPKKGKPPATNSNFMSSSSAYTGSNLDKPKKKKQGPRAGSRAAVNRKPTPPKPKRKPSLADQRRAAARRRRRGM